MDKRIKAILKNTLKDEADMIFRSDDDIKEKIARMNDIIHFTKIVDNYDELEPLLIKFFEEKAQKEKWER